MAVPVQPVDVHVAPPSVVRKSPPDEKLSDADTTKVCGSIGEAHRRGSKKNAGRPADESNQDAPLSVERSAPPTLSPEKLVHAATIFWSLPSCMISKSVTLSDSPTSAHLVPALASIGAAPDCSFGTCYSEVGTAEEDQIRIIDAETHVVKVGLIQGPLIRAERSPCAVDFPSIEPLLGDTDGPLEMAYRVPSGANRTLL